MTIYRFDPIFPAHAVEQCIATVVFSQPVPPKIFSGLLDKHRELLIASGMSEGPKAIGMQFDMLTGKVVPMSDGGPVSFVTPDKGTTLTIAPNQLSLQTQRYTRWAHFESSVDKFLTPVMREFCNSVEIQASQLDYWDRFIWTGDWDTFDVNQLLNPSYDLIAPKAARATFQWHSHAGWFEMRAPGERRLVNVNVDVTSVAPANAVMLRPSVGIYTSIQDGVVPIPPSTSPIWIPDAEVLGNFRQQHLDLKTLIETIISPAMARRIGL
jgi:uncharacterized protein (TIGR04255 family)